MLRDVHIIFHKLDKIAHVFINEKLIDSELSRGLFFFVLELANQDGISLHDLSRALFVDKAYTTRAVARLTDLGLVRKEEDVYDRRASRIYLTDEGRESAQIISDIFCEWRDLIGSGISEEEAELLHRISHKLIKNAMAFYSKGD